MDDDRIQDPSGVLNDFLNRVLDDIASGGLAPLDDYLAAFPGHDALIAGRYFAIAGETRSSVGPRGADGGALPSIGPYRILSQIGSGGMGAVFLAEQVAPIRRRVAVKAIREGMGSREILARFDAERQALAVLDHPNIAKVFDAGCSDDGRPYFVMELVHGSPIIAYCDAHRLPLRSRIELFIDVIDGVHHAHQRGIIHRDLKPSNVLVGEVDGRPAPKIIDFGIAKSIGASLGDATLLTHIGQFLGTPLYMSPEQARSGFVDIDVRADVYSLGVILYELVAGVPPLAPETFLGASLTEIEHRVVESVRPKLSTRLERLGPAIENAARERGMTPDALRRAVRGELEWISMKALEVDRSRRYASATDFAADLLRYLRGEPVLAGPPSLAYRTSKFVRRHRVAIGVLTAASILFVATIVTQLALERRGLRAASRSLIDSGRRALETRESRRDEFMAASGIWTHEHERLEDWEPIWRREREQELWLDLERRRAELSRYSGEALTSFYRAFERAPPGTPERREAYREIRRIHSPLGDTQRRDGSGILGDSGLPSEFFSILVGDQDYREIDREFDGPFPTRIESDPEGAEVFCFRYEFREGRLVPLPCAIESTERGEPTPRLVGEILLEVDRIWPRPIGPVAPFEAGDRLLRVDGHEVRTLRDLMRALESAPGGAVQVEHEREGVVLVSSWQPFTAPPNWNEIESARDALGVAFRGYPLEWNVASRLGTTPCEVVLPEGSYLIVFRAPGFVDARLPVVRPALTRERRDLETVRLLRASEIPPGFVYVPAGPFASGGDAAVHQSLPRSVSAVESFLMGRLEVSVGEYGEFLNAPENLERIDESGKAAPLDEWVIEAMRDFDDHFVQLVPESRREVGKLLYERDEDGRWIPTGQFGSEDWPVLAANVLAASEYARWLGSRHGGRWRFRLPTDLEWEKAARGVDGRYYVWGNYPVWSFARSARGTRGRGSSPCAVDSYPTDESVYGVRDLAGSASEPTTDVTEDEYRSVRGGNWYAVDHYFFRIANRNGSWPNASRKIDQGIRLVAELARE
jgi:serine/threonine protein kinase/formylglycine-generating enzyme required for sulfatase activity